jgi:hypothetical protein
VTTPERRALVARSLCEELAGRGDPTRLQTRLLARARREIARGSVGAETLAALEAALARDPLSPTRPTPPPGDTAASLAIVGYLLTLLAWIVPPGSLALLLASDFLRPLVVAICLASSGFALQRLAARYPCLRGCPPS